MRNGTLKFRVWDDAYDVMREVVRIDFKKPDDVSSLSGDLYDSGCVVAKGVDGENCTCVHIPLEEAELMQFTGLHDLNGKEIYEGDIIENDLNGQPFLIFYQVNAGKLVAELNCVRLPIEDWGCCTVIGHQYCCPDMKTAMFVSKKA